MFTNVLSLPLALLINTVAVSTKHGDDQPASATADTEIELIEVYGREIKLISTARAASQGVVGYDDFKNRPLSRIGELVEVIPGVIATQHSGEGKANQYFLRGFNLDHGTDFSVHVDHVPVNLRTHGHGQGYLDLNFIIPEIVERVDFAKGPYAPGAGDFSSAGSARYSMADNLGGSFAQLTVGEFGFYRGVAAYSTALSDRTDLLLAGEAAFYDGPWDLDQNLEKLNAYARLTHRGDNSRLTISASAYDNSWQATDQIPSRALDQGLISRFGTLDDDLGGDTHRYSLSANYALQHSDDSETALSAYAVRYGLNLWSNFTYFLDNPAGGDEFEQVDDRHYFGARLTHNRALSDLITMRAGAEFRHDDIGDVGLFRTAGRQRLSTVRQDEVQQSSIAAWADVDIRATERLRVTLGLRGDIFWADVDALSMPANGGTSDDQQLSPSLGLAWQAADFLEFYANYGRGFHSNDVRGTTISIDPATGDAATPVPLLVKSDGFELGLRYEKGPLRVAVAAFHLNLESELVFVGDAGTTEANDGSNRIGVEASAFWRATNWLVLDASGSYTRARFDIPGTARRIPGAVESVLAAGATAQFDALTISTRLRHFGPAPLIEDNSVRSNATTLVNLTAAYQWDAITFSLDVLNLFDARDADISYFFESQLPGEAAPVADLHFHPVEPRRIRASIRVNF